MTTARRRPASARITTYLTGLALMFSLATMARAIPAGADPSLLVATNTGDLRGKVVNGAARWLGIPYAQPPVGALRWHAPVPVLPWVGVRDATAFGSPCLQATTEYDDARGSEDCLYLNVYAPRNSTTNGNLPVMVWLHGGGFVNGSGNDFVADRLADTANALIVTVNYRLGPFGWLALNSLSAEQGGSSGDYGLMDQLAALQWVRANIAGFGGDPHLVTLFGQSAGGESVLALTASPLAQGVFQRGIAQSAPASLSLPTVAAAATRNEAAYATELGCTDAATQTACLRAVPAAAALAAGHESWNLVQDLGLYWTPTVGSSILPDQWLTLFKARKYNHVPLIIGHTHDEGRLFTAIYENANGHAMTTGELIDRDMRFFSVAAPLVLAAYNPLQYPTPSLATSAVITDGLFACGENRDRAALASTGAPAVYSYEFTDPNAFEVEVHGIYTPINDAHDAELPFLFQYNHGRIGPHDPPFTTEQRALATDMGEYWGNFARTGNPNGAGLPTWPRFTSATTAQTQILQPSLVRPAAGTYYRNHKCGLWNPLLTLKG